MATAWHAPHFLMSRFVLSRSWLLFRKVQQKHRRTVCARRIQSRTGRAPPEITGEMTGF